MIPWKSGEVSAASLRSLDFAALPFALSWKAAAEHVGCACGHRLSHPCASIFGVQ